MGGAAGKAARRLWKKLRGPRLWPGTPIIMRMERRRKPQGLYPNLIPILHKTVEPFCGGHRMWLGGVAARNVVNTVACATGAAASYAAIKRLAKLFY